MIERGRKVRLKTRKEITGLVIDERVQSTNSFYPTYEYKVKYDDEELLPPCDWHGHYDLEVTDTKLYAIDCTCGAKFTEFPKIHYDWCDKYETDD
jgi:hypothetical protein